METAICRPAFFQRVCFQTKHCGRKEAKEGETLTSRPNTLADAVFAKPPGSKSFQNEGLFNKNLSRCFLRQESGWRRRKKGIVRLSPDPNPGSVLKCMFHWQEALVCFCMKKYKCSEFHRSVQQSILRLPCFVVWGVLLLNLAGPAAVEAGMSIFPLFAKTFAFSGQNSYKRAAQSARSLFGEADTL